MNITKVRLVLLHSSDQPSSRTYEHLPLGAPQMFLTSKHLLDMVVAMVSSAWVWLCYAQIAPVLICMCQEARFFFLTTNFTVARGISTQWTRPLGRSMQL